MLIQLLANALRYWRYGLVVLTTSLLCLQLHNAVMAVAEQTFKTRLAERETALTDQCTKDQLKTERLSNEQQAALTDINRRLAAAKRLRQPTACVHVPAPTSNPDAATTGAGLPERNGISAAALLDFAADAERTGTQLDALQKFVREVYQQQQP